MEHHTFFFKDKPQAFMSFGFALHGIVIAFVIVAIKSGSFTEIGPLQTLLFSSTVALLGLVIVKPSYDKVSEYAKIVASSKENNNRADQTDAATAKIKIVVKWMMKQLRKFQLKWL